GLKIAEIEIMDEIEKEEVLRLSRGVEWSYEGLETIHGLFEEQVARTPDGIALVGANRHLCVCTTISTLSAPPVPPVRTVSLSYRQLNEQSNRLAYRLREKGVGPDRTVGLMVERSVEMITGILGIMKVGGAYLPIDSEYPTGRKKYMLEDGDIRWLLVNGNIEDLGDEIINRLDVINLGQEEIFRGRNGNLEHTGSGSNLVYVIYTSGSTGKPKGVMLEHRNLINLFKFQFKYTGIDCSRILQFSTVSFDASFHEIFSAFLSGGQLFLVNKETRTDIPELFRLIERNGIKTVFLPISFLKVIFKEEEYIKRFPRSIRHIQTAGEQVVVGTHFKNYLRERKVYLHNHYGPSETHVVTTLTIDPGGDITELPSIGKPVMNTGIYIVDKWGQLLPPGAAGELLVGGVQVGRGYLNRPELTCEKFKIINYKLKIKNGSGTIHHSILYRTGDLGLWLPDGNIEFLGRIDHQVKIRGFRIEPGEIESRLSNHPGVKEAVVSVQKEGSGDNYLCAYVVSDREYGISELREYLSKELPDYMIPSYFVALEKIPLTPNGKIDRRALPKPELKVGESYTAPRNEVEKKLVELWAEILGRDELHASQLQPSIGIDDNFFQLGGHSLKATVMVSKIHKVLNIHVPLAEIFKSSTIRGLAGYISEKTEENYEAIRPVEEKEYYELSSAQKRLYFLWQMEPDSVAYNLPLIISLPGGIHIEKLEEASRKLIKRHDSLRTSFHVINDEPVQRIHDNVAFEIEQPGGR
ncbi:MAG TPA: amino acid adenylation domain-containing protein, partial [Candidatus Deferrimicrobium sp.]|nr:amino acid adenylation domain-containing protein [Candidatus Deferrimicrobium sp.]